MSRNLVHSAATGLACAIAIFFGLILTTAGLVVGGSILIDPIDDSAGMWIVTAILLGAGITLLCIASTAQTAAPKPSASRHAKALKTGTARAIRDIVSRHAHTLYTERCKLLVPDKYGLVDGSKWRSERSHFIQNVGVPFLAERISAKQLHRECTLLLRSVGHTTGQRNWKSMAFDLIDREVERSCKCIAREVRSNTNQGEAFRSPQEFETWCAKQLEIAGWQCRVNGQSGDQGVDVLAKKNGRILAVQCKLYSQPAGNDSVQQVVAGKIFYKADYAAVVATAGYTNSARALAIQSEVRLLQPTELASFRDFSEQGQ